MASIDDLKSWFERDIKLATWAENVRFDAVDTGKLEIHLYTNTNEYILTVTGQNEEMPAVECAVQARKARAGLPSPRVRRLLRGRNHRLNERVWHRILGAIVGTELVRVHRPEMREESESSGPAADASAVA